MGQWAYRWAEETEGKRRDGNSAGRAKGWRSRGWGRDETYRRERGRVSGEGKEGFGKRGTHRTSSSGFLRNCRFARPVSSFLKSSPASKPPKLLDPRPPLPPSTTSAPLPSKPVAPTLSTSPIVSFTFIRTPSSLPHLVRPQRTSSRQPSGALSTSHDPIVALLPLFKGRKERRYS